MVVFHDSQCKSTLICFTVFVSQASTTFNSIISSHLFVEVAQIL